MSAPTDAPQSRRHTAGLFDIRTIIGALLGVYGVVLLVMAFVDTPDHDLDRAGGINANLWTGIGLVVVGGLFVVWAVTRPIVVDEAEVARDRAAAAEDAGPADSAGGASARPGSPASQWSKWSRNPVSTNREASGLVSLSLVWPWNCGSRTKTESMPASPPNRSSAVTLPTHGAEHLSM